jgi:hypothetical protein
VPTRSFLYRSLSRLSLHCVPTNHRLPTPTQPVVWIWPRLAHPPTLILWCLCERDRVSERSFVLCARWVGCINNRNVEHYPNDNHDRWHDTKRACCDHTSWHVSLKRSSNHLEPICLRLGTVFDLFDDPGLHELTRLCCSNFRQGDRGPRKRYATIGDHRFGTRLR